MLRREDYISGLKGEGGWVVEMIAASLRELMRQLHSFEGISPIFCLPANHLSEKTQKSFKLFQLFLKALNLILGGTFSYQVILFRNFMYFVILKEAKPIKNLPVKLGLQRHLVVRMGGPGA